MSEYLKQEIQRTQAAQEQATAADAAAQETALAQAMISARLLAGGHGPGWSHRGSNAGV